MVTLIAMKFEELKSSMSNRCQVIDAFVSKDVVPLNEVILGIPIIVVLGTEGKGLGYLVSRSFSQLIIILGTLTHIPLRSVDICLSKESLHAEELNTIFQLEILNVI